MCNFDGLSEKAIIKQIVKWLRDQGAVVCNYHPGYGTAGTPDLLGCINGTALAIEVKRPGNKPTKLQLHRIAQWKLAGAFSTWVDNLEELQTQMTDAGVLAITPTEWDRLEPQ